MPRILAYCWIIVTIIGYILYIRSIIRKETKPHAFSWIIRGIMTGTWFFAQRTETDSLGIWILGISFIVTMGIGIYSWFAYKHIIKKTDRRYFAAAIAWLIIRYITKTPFWSVIIISITDFLAFLPTFRKIYDDPYSEYLPLYALASLKFIFALISIGTFTIVGWLYPLYLIFANGWFVIFGLIRRLQKRKILIEWQL